MNLIKLPDAVRNGRYVYVNPNNVTYLYERDDKTYIVTVDTEQDDQGICVPLPIDEVAGRLMNGNTMYDVINTLKKNSEDGDSDGR